MLQHIITSFFLSSLTIYQIHRYTEGHIIPSPMLPGIFLFIFFFSFLIVNKLAYKPDIYLAENERFPRPCFVIAAFSTILLMQFWLWETSYGDYLRHIKWATQLYLGFHEGTSSYALHPNLYPPLSHACVAIIARLFSLSIPLSYFLFTAILNILMPFLAYRVGRAFRLDSGSAILLAALTALYGGIYYSADMARMHWLYFPAIQNKFIFISRNLSFFLFLLFLINLGKLFFQKIPNRNLLATIGILIGLLGNTHPNGFIVAIIFFFAWYFLFILRTKIFFSRFIVVWTLPGALLSLLYLAPTWFFIVTNGGLFPTLSGTKESLIALPHMLFFLIPFLHLPFWKSRSNIAVFTVAILCLVYFSIIIIKSVPTSEVIVFHHIFSRINRYGPYFVFSCFIVASYFYSGCLQRGSRLQVRFLSAFFILLLTIGSWVTGQTLTKSNFHSTMTRTIQFEIPARPPMIIAEKFSDLTTQLKNAESTTIITPLKGFNANALSSYTGLSLAYHPKPGPITDDFYKQFPSQEERITAVNDFYQSIENGRLRQDLMIRLGADMFVAPDPLELKSIVLKGAIDGFFIYELQPN